jgi:hypothetical protein
MLRARCNSRFPIGDSDGETACGSDPDCVGVQREPVARRCRRGNHETHAGRDRHLILARESWDLVRRDTDPVVCESRPRSRSTESRGFRRDEHPEHWQRSGEAAGDSFFDYFSVSRE